MRRVHTRTRRGFLEQAPEAHRRVQRRRAHGGHRHHRGRARAGRRRPARLHGALRRRAPGGFPRAAAGRRRGRGLRGRRHGARAAPGREPDPRFPRAPAPAELVHRARGRRARWFEGGAAGVRGHLRAGRTRALSLHRAHERPARRRGRRAAHRVRDAAREVGHARSGHPLRLPPGGRHGDLRGGRRASRGRAGVRHGVHRAGGEDHRPRQRLRGGSEEGRVRRCRDTT